RNDHRGDLPGGGHRHGRAAPDERLDSRREHGPHGGVDRGIGGGGRHLHHPGIRSGGRLVVIQPGGGVLEIHRPDGGGGHAGHPVRHAAAARDGGGSRVALSGVAGRFRDPQSGAAGQPGGGAVV